MILLNRPYRNTLKDAKIEKIEIEKNKLEELKKILADPKLADIRKHFVLRSVCGTCSMCGKLPSHIAKYRMYGAIIIEKYCKDCLSSTSSTYTQR